MDMKETITARRLDQYHKEMMEGIAPAETSPAQAAHQAGEYLTFKGVLYKVTSDIAVGGTLTPGENITRDTVAGMVGDAEGGSSGTNAARGQGYAVCNTEAENVEKTANLTGYELAEGGIVAVRFANAVPENATLNVNGKGAKPIYYRDAAISADVIQAGDTASFMYDGARYHVISVDRNEVGGGTADLGESCTTVFNADGSITQTYSDRIKNTVFDSDGSIHESLSTLDGTSYET